MQTVHEELVAQINLDANDFSKFISDLDGKHVIQLEAALLPWQYAASLGKAQAFSALCQVVLTQVGVEQLDTVVQKFTEDTLQYVVLSGQVAVIDYWIKNLAKQCSSSDSHIEQAIDLALANNLFEIAEQLINDLSYFEMYSPHPELPEDKQDEIRVSIAKRDSSWIKIACGYLSQNNQQKFTEVIAKLSYFSRGGIDLELVMAMLCNAPTDDALAVKFLHEQHQVAIDTVDAQGNTLLHLVARQGKPYTLRYLIDQGLNPNVPNQAGEYPLQLLTKAQIPTKDLLLAAGILCMRGGADIKVANRSGVNALEMALENKELSQVLQFLSTSKTRDIPPLLAELAPIVMDAGQPIKYLVLKGGGVKGLAYIGALELLENMERLRLADLVGVGGTSAGAIAAFLIGLGYSVAAIKKELWEMDFKQFLDVESTTTKQFILDAVSGGFGWFQALRNMKQLSQSVLGASKGLCKGEAVRQWLIRLIAQKGLRVNPELLTFGQLQAYGLKDMRIVGVNLTHKRTEVFSAATTPDMCVVDAVRISMSIPGVFQPGHKFEVVQGQRQQVSSDDYVDGGLFDNYPINLFDSTDANGQVLGLCLAGDKRIQQWRDGGVSSAERDAKVGWFAGTRALVQNVLACVNEKQNSDHSQQLVAQMRTIYIGYCGISTVNFALTEAQKQQLYLRGRADASLALNRMLGKPLAPLTANTLSNLIKFKVLTQDLFAGTIRLRINWEGMQNLTAEAIFKIYADASLAEIPHLKLYVNPNKTDKFGKRAFEYASCFQERYPRGLQNLQLAHIRPLSSRQQYGLRDDCIPGTVDDWRHRCSKLEQENQQLSEARQLVQVGGIEELYSRPDNSVLATIPQGIRDDLAALLALAEHATDEQKAAIQKVVNQMIAVAVDGNTQSLVAIIPIVKAYLERRPDALQNYQHAMQFAMGHTSPKLRALGVAMGVLGVIIAALGVLMIPGVATSLVTALGINFLATTGIGSNVITVGLGCASFGCGFFYHGGQKKLLAKAMDELVQVEQNDYIP